MTPWFRTLTARTAAPLLPIVILLGVYALGMSLLPGIKPALPAVPALAAAVTRHAWYPLVVGGIAVIVTTHRLDEAERLCDRFGLMHEGRLLHEGTLAELRTATG